MADSSLVFCQEATAVEVGHFLTQKGFVLADQEGLALDHCGIADFLGILSGSFEEIQKKYPFGFRSVKRFRIFLGVLYFQNEENGAIEEELWVFEVFGRKNMEIAKTLAEELSTVFLIRIEVLLVEEKRKAEKQLPTLGELFR